MAELDFTTEELLEQARGNVSAFFHVAIRWARERDGSVEGWATHVGEAFAPGWDEVGESAPALEVGRIAGLNMATTADLRPVELSGDESRAVLTMEGPEQKWLDAWGTTVEDVDRANELIFLPIARRRGLALTAEREGTLFWLTFAK